MQNFELIEKKNLTHNVFEMVFKWEKELFMKPWQFITFIIEKIWGRAYSILELKWDKIVLIIKKRELNEWGRWWSKMICELKIWDKLRWVWPAWHFILMENSNNKLFIWTGTGFVPLYNMIVSALENESKYKIQFIFWVREQVDIFYLKELQKLKSKNLNFDYEIFISRVKDLHQFELENPDNKINSWYTTNYLTKNNIENFYEVYICWAPTMIESTIEKLVRLWYKENENIFYEKY